MGYERPEANFIFRGALSREHAAKEPVLDPKVDRAEAPRRAEKAWRAGVMAVDIARVRSGIGIKLTPPSLFLQGIVDSAPFYAKTPASLVFVDSVADRAPIGRPMGASWPQPKRSSAEFS